MRLTSDVILRARASLNTLDERELDLRGYKIPVIENVGVTQDQFDTIDLSDNEVQLLGNFPRFSRLSTIILNNNHVSKISPDLSAQVPNLQCLVLTNNKISALSELEGLSTCAQLAMLSLLDNPVVRRQHYRLFAIHKIPSLKVLDFQKVRKEERKLAEKLFKSDAGAALSSDVASEMKESAKTFVPGEGPQGLSAERKAQVMKMIEAAESAEEVDRLERMLRAGQFPGGNDESSAPVSQGVDMEVEKEEAEAKAEKVEAAEPPPSAKAKAKSNKRDASAVTAHTETEAAPPAPESAGKGRTKNRKNKVVAEEEQGGGEDGEERKKKEAAAAAEAEAPPSHIEAEEGKEGGTRRAKRGRRSSEGASAPDGDKSSHDTPSEGQGLPSVSEEDILKMKVADLKKELTKRSLDTKGLKKDLVARLLAACGH